LEEDAEKSKVGGEEASIAIGPKEYENQQLQIKLTTYFLSFSFITVCMVGL
jgi:hypothetical protein